MRIDVNSHEMKDAVEPLMSIIIPVYKVPEIYLRKCICSCIDQSVFNNIEIIIIHDASNDDCGQICDEYAEMYRNIIVKHKEERINGGLSAARNDGVKLATSKWITFLDGDDWLERDACEQMMRAVQIYSDVQIVITGEYKDYNGLQKPYKYFYEDGEIFDEEGCKRLQIDVLDFRKNISGVYAKLISREFLIENDIFHDNELKQGVEGIEFNVRMFGKANRAVFVKCYTYHYMYNDSSLSTRASDKTTELVYQGLKKIESYINSSENNGSLRHQFNNRILYVVITTAISGYFNPLNKMSYVERKQKYKRFLEKPLIRRAMLANADEDLSFARKMTLFFIRYKSYRAVQFIAVIRSIELHVKSSRRKNK